MSASIIEILGELRDKNAMIEDKKGNTIFALVMALRSTAKWGMLVKLDQTDLVSGGGSKKRQPFYFPCSKIKDAVPADPEDREKFEHRIKLMQEIDAHIGHRGIIDMIDMGKLDVELKDREGNRVFVNMMEAGGRRYRLSLSNIKSVHF